MHDCLQGDCLHGNAGCSSINGCHKGYECSLSVQYSLHDDHTCMMSDCSQADWWINFQI